MLPAMTSWRTALRELFIRETPPAHVDLVPPARSALISEPTSLPDVYRAVFVLTTAISQLSMDTERDGVRVPDTISIVRRPNSRVSRSEFYAELATSLALTGNAYMRKTLLGTTVIDLTVLDPHQVTVWRDDKDQLRYAYRGHDVPADQIEHCKLIPVAGAHYGLGPIQALRATLKQTSGLQDYLGRWWDDTGQPAGVLKTDQAITTDDAVTARNRWNGLNDDGTSIAQTTNPSRIKVLGKGMDYKPILLKPKDAQFIEQQHLTTEQVGRVFGVPPALMLHTPAGSVQSYSNVEQDWLGFTRFTVMAYLRPIEEAFTNLTPRGQSQRFNLEVLLRSDTKTRYESHAIGISSGFLAVNEVRAVEGRPPIHTTTSQEISENS